jgi:predicted nucleic acid-binding protein
MGEWLPVADTSFLYALFSKSDVFHGKARKAAATADSILVPTETYSETISLIQYRAGFGVAKAAGDWLRSQRKVQVSASPRSVLDRSWGIFRDARGRLSYPDAVVLAWCRERRTAPLAFDQAILRRTRK